MKKTLFVLLVSCLSCSTEQNKDKTEIMMVVNQVFEAMRTNDSTRLKAAFVEQPNTYTVYQTDEGQVRLASGSFEKFKNAVGQPKEQVWNEPIWNEKVEIDGALASVWVDYAFYVDDQFSHCGVDAFHLVKQEGKWKIFHLVDTRRKENCDIPDEIRP